MDAQYSLVSPKPIKTNSSSHSIRKSYLRKLNFDGINQKPSAKSTRNIEKNFHETPINIPCFLVNSQNFNTDCDKAINETSDSNEGTIKANFGSNTTNEKPPKKELKLNFFEEYERELADKECTDEIFSIISDSFDVKTRHTSFQLSTTPVSSQSGNYNFDLKDLELDLDSNQRASFPPSCRPKNAFYKNFDNNKEMEMAIENIRKCISVDFQL